jgi:hypothetical protein
VNLDINSFIKASATGQSNIEIVIDASARFGMTSFTDHDTIKRKLLKLLPAFSCPFFTLVKIKQLANKTRQKPNSSAYLLTTTKYSTSN